MKRLMQLLACVLFSLFLVGGAQAQNGNALNIDQQVGISGSYLDRNGPDKGGRYVDCPDKGGRYGNAMNIDQQLGIFGSYLDRDGPDQGVR